jgi:hypothetical protein
MIREIASTVDDVASAGDDKDPAEAELARLLVKRLNAAGQRSTAEMLRELRRAFPRAPLSVRIAALAAINSR